jgi:hypothetical protein
VDGIDQLGRDLAPAGGLEGLEVILDVLAERPGVLVAGLHLEREGMRLDAHRVRRRMSSRRNPKGVRSRERSMPWKRPVRAA